MKSNKVDYSKLNRMHQYLMEHKFPYHSVSVACTDRGYELIFMENVKEYVSNEIRQYASRNDFAISFVS